MRTVNLIFSRMGRSVIPLGMEGEHGVTTVRFDLSEELEHRPNASVTIKATSAAGVTYSPETRLEGTTLVWPVHESDTAARGRGEAQIIIRAEGEKEKSAVVTTVVNRSVMDADGDPP